MKRIAKNLVVGVAAATISFSLAGVGTAHAQKKAKANPAPAQDAQRVKSYDFSGDEIDGDLVKPDGEFLDTRKFATHTSLISIRQDFIREIVKSAEDL
jgi:hypothetical protein